MCTHVLVRALVRIVLVLVGAVFTMALAWQPERSTRDVIQYVHMYVDRVYSVVIRVCMSDILCIRIRVPMRHKDHTRYDNSEIGLVSRRAAYFY